MQYAMTSWEKVHDELQQDNAPKEKNRLQCNRTGLLSYYACPQNLSRGITRASV